MVRQRRPVQSLQESLAPRLAPQAAPVGFTPTVAPPDDLPIYDFSAISQTLAGYLRKQQENRNKQTQQRAEQFVEENRLLMADLQLDMAKVKDPAERDRMQKAAFAFLRKSGEIPDMSDPNARVGLERANGRILAGQYWQNLQRRLTEVSLAVDPQTGLPTQPLDAERIMAEEWEKISQAPAVKGYYGGQEALAQKEAADAQFLQKVTERRNAAEKAHYEQTIAQEWGQSFDYILDNNDAVSSAELAPITEMVAGEVREHNLLNPREVLLNALELSFRRRAAIDPKDAVRAVHAAQDIVIGGVRLGDDRSGVGERLQELIRQVRDDANEAEELELRGEDTARRLAIQKGQADFLPKLLQAQREGQSLRQIGRALSEQYLADDEASARFGGRGAFVVRNMQETIQQLEQDASDDPDVVSAVTNHLADGQTDAARALVDSAGASGRLRGETRLKLTQAIEQRENVGRFLEDDNLYNEVKGRYNQATPKGFARETQERLDAEALDFQRRLDRDYAEQVRLTTGNPQQQQILRDWLMKREEADNKQRTEQGAQMRAKRDKVNAALSERVARLQDSADLIAQAEAEGSYTIAEAEEARAKNRESISQKDHLQNVASDDALALLENRVSAALGGVPPDQNQITKVEDARRRLRDQIGLELDKMIADPANDPRTFVTRARAIGDTVVDELSPTLLKELGPATLEISPITYAAVLRDKLADPFIRETFRASDPVFAPATDGSSLHTPGIPQRFYEFAAGWWSGRDPIFGDPVDRPTMMMKVGELAVQLRRAPDRDQVLAGALDIVGIDALDVVRGKTAVVPARTPQLEQSIQGWERVRDHGWTAAARAHAAERVVALRGLLEPIPVSLEGHQYKPYLTPFFQSRTAFNQFSNDPAYPDFLRKIGVNPDDPKEVSEWVKYQTIAIDRSAQ